jgi:tRNA threonylcarbamoyladenosine biosynthesis protein TsaB
MQRIVALDTTSELGSIALVEAGRVLEEVPLAAADGFGHVLFPALERLLDRHGWEWHTVACYAAAAGPGSFTGVRVGLAAVKGLAEATGARAAGVSTLAAIAWHGHGALRAAFADARRGEVYGGLYDAHGALQGAEVCAPLQRWLDSLPAGAALFTPDPAPFAAAVGGRQLSAVPRALAGAVGLLAAARMEDPAVLDANYVRRSDAELNWRDPR